MVLVDTGVAPSAIGLPMSVDDKAASASQNCCKAVDRRRHAGDLVARVRQQLEHADEHAVVAKNVFLGHGLSKRHDLIAVVPGQVVGRAVG